MDSPDQQKMASHAYCFVLFVFLGGLWFLERALSAQMRNFPVFVVVVVLLFFVKCGFWGSELRFSCLYSSLLTD